MPPTNSEYVHWICIENFTMGLDSYQDRFSHYPERNVYSRMCDYSLVWTLEWYYEIWIILHLSLFVLSLFWMRKVKWPLLVIKICWPDFLSMILWSMDMDMRMATCMIYIDTSNFKKIITWNDQYNINMTRVRYRYDMDIDV